MQHVVIVIHLMLVLALIGVVLLQKSEGGGLGIGGGGGFMTSRGTGNVLTTTTWTLAALFFVTSLLLSIIAGLNRKPATILQGGQSAPTAPGPAVADRRERHPQTIAGRAGGAAGCPRGPVRAAGAAIEIAC